MFLFVCLFSTGVSDMVFDTEVFFIIYNSPIIFFFFLTIFLIHTYVQMHVAGYLNIYIQ